MALILNRKEGESIVLVLPSGEKAVVTYLGKNHYGQVRLGITAPTGVTVDRGEVREKKEDGHG